MQTNVKPNPIQAFLAEASAQKTEKAVATDAHDGPFAELYKEHNRFAIITFVILITGCLGGIAVGLGGLSSVTQLILLVIPTMTTLALLLAVQPLKYIVYAALTASIIDIAIILINTI